MSNFRCDLCFSKRRSNDSTLRDTFFLPLT
ncbi:hypothetical protein NOCA2540031 [metagenome]|uniref:Uncharacterized protein n=1 Tax=metagenome TaxID=256318 RepID=A0A2P2C9W8_9ZZZZ